jgi:predicted dehydrogenase
VISAQAYVGQYLPYWRPDNDYRKFYSAHKSEGGGVLRDLSHELDFVNWLLGGWKSVSAVGGHFSDLEIDSDDMFLLILEMENCPVATIQLNYLDRAIHRHLIVNTNLHVYQLDFIKKTFQKNGNTESFSFDRNHSYLMQHQAILDNNFQCLCSLKEGEDVMRIIHAAEMSAYSDQKCWVNNEANL